MPEGEQTIQRDMSVSISGFMAVFSTIVSQNQTFQNNVDSFQCIAKISRY